MDLPDIYLTEGGGNWHKPSSSPSVIGVNRAEVDKPATESKNAAEDGPGTADEFTALENWWNVDNNGNTDEMAWYSTRQEEVKDQLNDSEKSDISAIDIISRYWKSSNGKLMVKVTRLHVLDDDTVETGYVNIY